MKRVLKWIGIGLGGIVGLVVLFAVVMAVVGGRHVDRSYADLPVQAVSIPAPDSAVLAEGARLVGFYSCQACHGDNLGGHVMGDAPPFHVVAPNLTTGAGGIGGTYTDQDWVRALHHGVGHDGRPLLIMPSTLYTNVDAARLGTMIAYLKQLPPVDNELPPTEVKPLGRILAGLASANFFSVERIDHDRPLPAGEPPTPTAAYGAYLASTYCVECHGADLRGGQGPMPEAPPAPDLAASGAWPQDAFTRLLRTGIAPDGRQVDPEAMPWNHTRHLTDVEIQALQEHLKTLAQASRVAAR